MNILQVSKHMSDSGVNSHIIQLSQTLKQQGHRVIVVSSGGPHTEELDQLGIKHFQIPFLSKNPIVKIMNLFSLVRLIRSNEIEIAHTHWRSTGIYLKLASMFTGTDFVWTNHLNHIPSSKIYKFLTFYGKSAITVSSDMLPMLNKKLGIPEKKLNVVFNGVDSKRYIKYSKQKKEELKKLYEIGDKKVISLLGRLTPVKGHLFLLDSLAKMRNQIGDISQYKILFAGDGSEEYKSEIIQKAKTSGLIDNIVFTGYVNPVDILNISDVMVLPSKNEGFPIVCIEAFAMQVPVIRTKTGGYSDVKDYCVGVDYGDTQALSEALIKVLSNEEWIKGKVSKAHHFYEENLTSEKMAQSIFEVYKKEEFKVF
ncbi:glycosyltransferase [Mangrovibacillus cuniculi]|uniref:Glycosyltransferase family 4 protein n=1 Tax=Mangrovibacillus cuniculi TaxID=2593652 RepID=A0A7S8CD50_9BACI|nr:glycosyltransferase [Mangrovibacillus cuniculi]QPC47651.1 glycosyltransferase family 4 protein [Mangrovibacillus cuniculi]